MAALLNFKSGYEPPISYDVEVPEEAGLLVVAWLVENGYAKEPT